MSILKRILKYALCLLAVVVFLFATFVAWFVWASADEGAAYAAKLLATGVFVAERAPESVAKAELRFVPFLKYEVDRDARTVTAWTIGNNRKTAVYREGLGVALVRDGQIGALRERGKPGLIPDLSHLAGAPWPMGDGSSGNARPGGIDEAALTAAVDRAFTETTRFDRHRTRALVVVYDGEIVAERYAPEFGPSQRFAGWSMTKSALHALYGIAVRDGVLSVEDQPHFWRDPADPRSAVTIDMMLRMSSGLAFGEFDFLPPSDLVSMLFLSPDTAAYAARLPLAHAPDTVWAYASGTTNMLSAVLREAYGDDAYHALPYRELFGRLGMRSAIIETDASGTFVCSSFMFATARDYARFGMLYAQDGVWMGERILPEGWVEYARTPSAIDQPGPYGAHWWLPTAQEKARARERGTPIPEDAFHASGFEGQAIVVVPSRRLVIVRLGLRYFMPFPPYGLLCDVLETLPRAETAVALTRD